MKPGADVFISYAREDAAQAEQLAQALEAAGYSCWWDRNLVAGSRYLVETEAQLKAAKAVVVIWSKASITSHWVADEAAVGRDAGLLAAISFDSSTPPLGFRQFQVADFSGWQGGREEASFRNLLAGLQRVAPRPGASDGPPDDATARPARTTAGSLPRRLEPLIGRVEELAQLASALSDSALVTLTGPGGIGKTRLAIEAARAAAAHHADGAWFVELASLSDPMAIPGAIAQAMGIEIRIDPHTEILERLRSWRALIVLDNCEHLIEAAAALIEQVLQSAPGICFLATSQEVLGVEGERVLRLRSLQETQAEELFLRRAAAADASFIPEETDHVTIRQICQRLDGVPLAIEMAAARAPALGCMTLLKRLDDRFRHLSGGRRTALPRQRTLQATLDWSHSLLTPDEATVFCRLSIFSGGWTLDAACRVLAHDSIDEAAVEEALTSLVAKSLVVIGRDRGMTRYRMLETMRAYALHKLAETGETQVLRRRHALYLTEVFEPALEDFWGGMGYEEFSRLYAGETENFLAGLEWAFGPEGDRILGAELLARGYILFHRLSRFEEAVKWVERALTEAAEAPPAVRSSLLVARLMLKAFCQTADLALLEETQALIPADSEQLTLQSLIVVSASLYTVTRRDEDRARSRALAVKLACNPLSYAGLWLDYCDVWAISLSEPADRPRLRSASDRLVAASRETCNDEILFITLAQGDTSDAPWLDDPAQAILRSRELVKEALSGEGRTVSGFALAHLAGRLVMALCQRAGPADLSEARTLCVDIERRFGLIHAVQRRALVDLAIVTHGPAAGGRLLGWLSNFPTMTLAHAHDREFRRMHTILSAALSQDELAHLLAEGARLTNRQAMDLALGGEGGQTLRLDPARKP